MMRTLTVAAGIALLLTGVAMGQTSVAYTLGVGGDNHAAAWKANPTVVPAFTPGTASSPLDITSLSTITWDVAATVTGGTTVDTTYYPCMGLANGVFDVTLYEADGVTPVTGDIFFSTINDGTAPDNKTEKAAFCMIWQGIDPYTGDFIGVGPPINTGRVVDAITDGGAKMDRANFPSTAGFGGGRLTPNYTAVGTTTTTIGNGALVGMGCGYTQMDFIGSVNMPGVGIQRPGFFDTVNGVVYIGLGNLPIAEGQIDVSGLAPGTYILKVTVPTKDSQKIGTNVVAGDYDLAYATGGFAVAADEIVDGATFTLTKDEPEPNLAIAQWASRRLHGTTSTNRVAAEIIKTVSPAGASVTRLVEPRRYGVSTIVATFSTTPVLTGATINAVMTTTPYTVIPAASQTVVGNTIEIVFKAETPALPLNATTNVSPITDRKCYTIDLAGKVARASDSAALTGDANINLQACQANVDGVTGASNNVTVTDLSAVNGNKSTDWLVVQTKPWFDVDTNKTITVTDLSFVNGKKFTSPLVTCP